ncbi:uncharacterized protein LOC131244408 [Magnolia sinica]|uniref:uncharacterized protein LOC131244408 n=1 Tax=Magnolia sinica TaxID=86752 RepID=UPI00265A6CB0|nr:uncharacterized protein LOC131244408 [Magnolia sinica]
MNICSLNLRSTNQVIFPAKISTFLQRIPWPQRPFCCNFEKMGPFEAQGREIFEMRVLKSKLTSCRSPSVRVMGMKKNHDNSSSSGSDDHSAPDEDNSSFENTNSMDPSIRKSHHIFRDWRTYRAILVAWERLQLLDADAPDQYAVPSELSNPLGPKWAHPISMPETGCILVATEKLDGVNKFERSVVLLLRAGTKDPGEGPFGIVISHPLHKKIKDMKFSTPELATNFMESYLYFGGPLEASTFLFKTCDNLPVPGFEEVIPGLCFGARNSLYEATQLVKKGVLKPQDFSFFVGYAGWQLDQLREEIESGNWFVAACSIDLICGVSPDSSSGLWEEILQLMGGHYSELSRKPKQDSS